MLTLDPHVGRSCDGENQEEEDEDEGFQVVGCHPLDPKEDSAQQPALEGRDGGLSWAQAWARSLSSQITNAGHEVLSWTA